MQAMQHWKSSRLLTVLLLGLLAGCGGLRTTAMIPDSAGTVTTHHAKSIRIGTVTGNKKEFFGGPEMIKPEEFRAVLSGAFSRAKLFDSVQTGAADLEISATFLAHGQVSSGFDVEHAMVVEYRLLDLRSGKEIWTQSINSRQAAKLSDAWGGAARTRMAQEGCVRKNLDQLITALAKLRIE